MKVIVKMKVRYILLSLLLLLAAGLIAIYHPEQPLSDFKAKYEYPDSRYVEVNGVNVHYRICGQGPNLVLLHGTGANIHFFDSITGPLSKHFRVISLDELGHGLTGPDPKLDYSKENYLRFFEVFFQKTGLDSMSIAGNSTGGYFAMLYALHHPDKVQHIVLLDSRGGNCPQEEKTQDWKQRLEKYFADPRNLPLLNTISRYFFPKFAVRKALETNFYDPRFVTEELVQNAYDMFTIKGNRTSRMEFSKFTYPNDILDSLSTPTLMIYGREDHIHSICQAEDLHRRLKNSRLVILDKVAHLPMLEAPHPTIQLMEDYLLPVTP